MQAFIREAALGFAPLLAVSLAALPLTAQSAMPGPPAHRPIHLRSWRSWVKHVLGQGDLGEILSQG